jgi:AraC-binding-like domain
MGIGMNIEPLDSFPFIRTTDVDEMREAIAKTHGDNKLQLHRGAKGFHACGNRRVLGNIVLSYVTFGAAVEQKFSAFTGFAQQFRIRGSSEILVERATPVQLAPHQSHIVSPGATMKVTHSGNLEHFVLKIDRDALLNKWTALTGRQPRGDLKFEPVADSRTPEATYLRRLFMFIVDQLGSSERSVPPLALAELAQSVIVSFLCANRHDETHLLDRGPVGTAPWQVRRAEEYIEAHWDQPITVEALAVAAGQARAAFFISSRPAVDTGRWCSSSKSGCVMRDKC